MKKRAVSLKIAFYAPILISICAILAAAIPWYGNHLVKKSLEQAELGYQVESLHSAESAIKYNPLSVNAYFVLAGTRQRIGHDADARTALIKATQLQPLNYQTWEQLALYERDRWHEPEKASEHFKKAVSLNPNDKYLRKEAGIPAE
jgi:tetratricopeptide (TPR) repeat protein